jgi:predicted GNAT family N-acyltransferase
MKEDRSVTQYVEQLYRSIQEVIETSRAAAYRAANASMVQAYWNIGRLIVEQEQKGDQRAGYGQQLIESVSMQLQAQYGKGFTPTNLKYMRQFYRLFKKVTHCVTN